MHPFLDSRTAADPAWQMTFGERFALEGLVRVVRPALAIETGTADGGSLRCIAGHAGEVHCFDLDPDLQDVVGRVPNAHAHVGDSAETLPATLARFAEEGRQVDFALIDGDHSTGGVQRDALAILESPACTQTTIVFHDAANDLVRAGLEALALPTHPKVGVCVLDFVPGYVVAPGSGLAGEIWNGLALVVLELDASGTARTDLPAREPVPALYREWLASRAGASRPAAGG